MNRIVEMRQLARAKEQLEKAIAEKNDALKPTGYWGDVVEKLAGERIAREMAQQAEQMKQAGE